MRCAVALLACALLAHVPRAHGQTIAPVISEYHGKARGKFQIVNPWLQPMKVVLEPASFTVDSVGQPHFSSLDSSIHLRLSTTSFRVGPKEIYTVFYEARSDRLPAWFSVYATVAGDRPAGGLQVALRLPHTVYLLTKRELIRDSVLVHGASLRDTAHRVVAVVESRGTAFGRVKEVEVRSANGARTYAGFPLFPGQRRMLELDWNQTGVPERLVLKFEKFDVVQRISP